ncbi:MAG: amino acid decarboxylase [Oscillospiraceae bacterium]|nr:amino acid decarboxylase [Oscillospiraceae bacterium]
MTLREVWEAYAGKGLSRFHMPGHKGVLPPPFAGAARIDLTELDGTGDLYFERDGAIRQSERGMAALFGAEDCFYLTGGATQGIFAMLAAVTGPGDTVHLWRGCHRSVTNALALLDLRPAWFWDAPEGVTAPVLYTSPDYYGKLYPRPKTEGPVLCDAAHGAHLPFCLTPYAPPGNLWVTSAHKTLNALGQTALLLSDGSADPDGLREQTAVFGTASPSFALLASLDAARAELAANGALSWARVAAFTKKLARDSRVFVDDPAKAVVTTGDGTGDARRFAEEFSVVCETADRDRMVFMLSPNNTDGDFSRLEKALSSVPARGARARGPDKWDFPEAVMTPREAFFAPRERVPLRDAVGRIAARAAAPSPPGVPFAAPGELLGKKTLDIAAEMCYTGEEPIWVVRNGGHRTF